MPDIKFYKSFRNVKDLPKGKLPEVVLCGRANVGKSSFINSFFNRKNLAKTSSTPGKTKSLNYFSVDEKFYLVDLPGYGFSKVSKKEQELWSVLIEEYFRKSKNIKLVFHLIDSRHDPTKLDMLLNEYINKLNLNYVVIFTKVDKLKQSEMAKLKGKMKSKFPGLIFGENAFLYSSVSKVGKKEIKDFLSKTLNLKL